MIKKDNGNTYLEVPDIHKIFDKYGKRTPNEPPPIDPENPRRTIYCNVRVCGTDRINLDPMWYEADGNVWREFMDGIIMIRDKDVDWVPDDKFCEYAEEMYPIIKDNKF